MASQLLDARGLKCPQPTLKITVIATKLKVGDQLEVVADCPSFENDVRDWCARAKKVMLWMKPDGDAKRCLIQF
jgi:tRNA 2-thiouridine synthesizing protein A